VWQVQGSIVDHEYETCGPAGKVGAVGTKSFCIADPFGIEVALGHVDALVAAVVTVVDGMEHQAR
jgi:uncharacterized protein YxjI